MTDFGDLGTLATALGLIKDDSFNDAWFSAPEESLKTILSDPDQRSALIESVDELLGGSDATTEGGRTWLPIFEHEPAAGGRVSVALVLDEAPAGTVHIGVGVRVGLDATATTAGARVDAFVPLFAAGAGAPILLGTAAGVIDLAVAVDLPEGADAGDVQLDAVELAAHIPTDGVLTPRIELALRGLRLPGLAPTDLVIDEDSFDDLGGTLLQLVLSLVRAQAQSAGPQAHALAGLLGLIEGDSIPDFPFEGLFSEGPSALAVWWADALRAPAHDEWLEYLAELLGTTFDAGAVTIDVGTAAQVGITLDVVDGTAGLPRVVPRIRVSAAGADAVTLIAEAQPVSLDLATGAAVALPSLRVVARIEPTAGDLLGPVAIPDLGQVRIDALEVGFALDADRRPTLRLAAVGVDVGPSHFDELDLTDADALGAAATTTVTNAAAALLAQLGGTIGPTVSTLIGLDGPPALRIDAERLFTDPIGAFRDRWRAVLASPPDVVRDTLTAVQTALADGRRAADAIVGDGSLGAPFTLGLAPDLDLLIRRDGTGVAVELAASRSESLTADLRVSLALRAGLLRADLDAAHASAAFVTGLVAVLRIEPAGATPLSLDTGGITIRAESLGTRVMWVPGDHVRVDPWLEGADVEVGPPLTTAPTTIDLAALQAAGLTVGGPEALVAPARVADLAMLTADAWNALESLAGAMLAAAPDDASSTIADLAGWLPDAAAGAPRLSIAALLEDPAAEIERWVRELAGFAPDTMSVDDPSALLRLLERAATLIGTPEVAARLLQGAGTSDAPWRLGLTELGVPGLDLLATAAGELADRVGLSDAAAAVAGWATGDPLPEPAALLAALGADAATDAVLGDAMAGRQRLEEGIDALVARWAGTDGVVGVAETLLPPGITVHRPAGLTNALALDSAAVTAALSDAIGAPSASARVVFVGVMTPGEPDLLPGGASGEIDLTAAGVAPATFPVPLAASAGVTVVRLAGRSAAVGPAGGTGFDAQVARLRRAFTGLAPTGSDVTVIAVGGAGKAATIAAEGTGVTRVVTVGTPWTPVTIADLDSPTAGEAARWIRTLLGLLDDDAAAPASDDLALARGLVDAFLARDEVGEPLAELDAPAVAIPAGVAVHAIIGRVDADQVRRAITAVVSRVLDLRAAARVAEAAAADAVSSLAARIPTTFGTAPGGLRATVTCDVDLLRSIGEGVDALLGEHTLRASLRLYGDGRWLVGGPDAGRAPGPRPFALRAMTLETTVPFSTTTPSAISVDAGRLVLHDAAVFGIRRARWVIDLTDASALLPELRALLGEVAAAIRDEAVGTATRAADPGMAALRGFLEAFGVLGVDGGFDAVTLTALIGYPAPTLRAALSDLTRRDRIAAALRVAAGDSRPDAGASVRMTALAGTQIDVDLAALTVHADVSAGPLTIGLSVGQSGAQMSAELRAHPLLALTCALEITGGEAQISAVARVGTAGGEVPLWPAGPATIDSLRTLLPEQLGATVLRLVLDALRAELSGGAATLIDALLAAVGLLDEIGETAAAAQPALRWADALIHDPGGWLTEHASGALTAIPDGIDALRELIDPAAVAAAGSLPIADGVALRAQSTGGVLRVGIDVDAAQFGDPASDLVAVITAGVSVSADGRVLPDAVVRVGADPGALSVRVGVDSGSADARVGVTVSLQPASSPELILFPVPHGLAGLLASGAQGAAVAILPRVLTAFASNDPGVGDASSPIQIAGRIVARAGVALGLAEGAPAVFTSARLADFVSDPVAALSGRAAALVADGLTLLAEGVEALIGDVAGLGVSTAGGAVTLELGPAASRVVLVWNPGANTLAISASAASVPGVERASVSATVHGTNGLTAFAASVGPAAFDIAGVTLAPFTRFRADATDWAVDVGLGVGDESRLLARFGSSGVSIAAEVGPFDSATLQTAPEAVVLTALEAVLDLAGNLVLQLDAVQNVLTMDVGDSDVATVLEGVLLDGGSFDASVVADFRAPMLLLGRLGELAAHVADALDPIEIGDALKVEFVHDGARLGVSLDLIAEEFSLSGDSDITVALVTDSSWIVPPLGAEGIVVWAAELAGGTIAFAPSLAIAGVGIRVGRSSGALLDSGLKIESVGFYTYGEVGAAGLGGGLKLELAGLAVDLGGASGGDNAVAQGVMPAGGTGENAPAPKFNPSLALVKRPGESPTVRVAAGSGNGPWWLRIQREFGPIYLEQVGLSVTHAGNDLTSIGVLIDGKVDLFGFSAAVDDLSLTYFVTKGSPFSAANWAVDVAGFAISAETGGLTLAGGLRKYTYTEGGVEYLGMLLARFGIYGISVYGGFGEAGPPNDRYTSLFLFGAVNGPIGGVPAFFITGIGGGFGVNRRLIVPTDLNDFPSYPLIKALDPSARAGDPFTELEQARSYFPAERGTFWFAGGLSFTSFSLVQGIVVVAVQFGNGFELSILGLARMALPRPEATLVSIELALVARVSESEGVVLVQAQLTENSWLLMPSVRLTGGFAFASWFKGPNKGQFVLTMGGYHPDFHRDGYPVVPRLGLQLQFGDFITIRGETYFALTSEALMAGARIDIHAELGPAWAHLTLGADAIVYFDPFWLSAAVYASVRAGVTIDLWLGEITIEISLSARMELTGPPFHARATLEIGPVSVTVEIGDKGTPEPIEWSAFVPKYLEEAAPAIARALSAITGAGTIPPAGSSETGGATSPDGQPDRPYRVMPEFTATMISTIPLREVVVSVVAKRSASHVTAIAPMRTTSITPRLTIAVRKRGADGTLGAVLSADDMARIGVRYGEGFFPRGVWGAAQDEQHKPVPDGDVLRATDRVELTFQALIPGEDNPAVPNIPYRQVETRDRRRILPLLASVSGVSTTRIAAGAEEAHTRAKNVWGGEIAPADQSLVAEGLLSARGGQPPVAARAWRAALAAPARLGFLGETVAPLGGSATVIPRIPAAPPVHAVRAPVVIARLASAEPSRAADEAPRTTVSDALLKSFRLASSVRRATAPTLASVAEHISPAVSARLVRSAPAARVQGRTVVPTGSAPVSRRGGTGAAAVRGAAARRADGEGLSTANAALFDSSGVPLDDGTVMVLALPDAATDTAPERPTLSCESGSVRAIVLGGGAHVLADRTMQPGDDVELPVDARSVVLVGGPQPESAADEAPAWLVAGGWAADMSLPSASDGLLIGAGCVLDVPGQGPTGDVEAERVAWTAPAELLAAEPTARTVLPAHTGDRTISALAVGITGAGTDGVALGLIGATETGERFVTTDAGGATVIIVEVIPDDDVESVTLAVSAHGGGGDSRHISGVAAASALRRPRAGAVPGAAAWLADAIAQRGLAAAIPPPTRPGVGTSTIRWRKP